jgi:GNAT superfamily N-acetyltransferase
MATIRSAVAGDAQQIGAVFDAAVRQGWTYLGELAPQPMFPPDEWDKLIIEHAPPNVLPVAVNEAGNIVGFTAVHPREGEIFLLFVHPEHAGCGVCRALLDAARGALRAEGCCEAFLLRTSKTQGHSRCTKRPVIAATAPCANRTFVAFACESRGW